jgi:hypothetical protein
MGLKYTNMTNKEYIEKLSLLPLDALIVKADDYVDRQVMEEPEYFDGAMYSDWEGNTQRGKIIVI